MNIVQIYKQFPNQQDCINHLEQVRWKNKPTCPYCGSQKYSEMKKENRYHCNTCNTSYSVMVGTIFENTKLKFQKWFLAISLVLNAKKDISARQLARDIGVTKDTAWYMLMRLRRAMIEYGELLEGIVEADETYIGGKNRNRHKDKKIKGTQGRNTKDKTAVAGVLDRAGKRIIAKKVKDVKSRTLKSFINQNVKKGAVVSTDDWKSYRKLTPNYKHIFVKHSEGEYVKGKAHTNTIEGFWSLLKRGIMGQYHNLSKQYLNKYIDEFCFRYNHRDNPSIFQLTLQKALLVPA